MKKLKIAEWNINGRSGFGGNYMLPVNLIVSELLKQNADVMVLTEFVEGNGILDLEVTLERVGYDLFTTVPGIGNGVAIIAKKELEGNIVSEHGNMPRAQKGEVDWPNFLCVRLNEMIVIGTRIRVEKKFIDRKAQFDMLMEYVKDNFSDETFVITGDFNNGNIHRDHEADKYYDGYDKNLERYHYNYQMIYREVTDTYGWTFLSPGRDKANSGEYSIMTSCGDTKDDHMITNIPDSPALTKRCKYDWSFVNERNGYGKRNATCVLSDLIGKPDHGMLVCEVEV